MEVLNLLNRGVQLVDHNPPNEPKFDLCGLQPVARDTTRKHILSGARNIYMYVKLSNQKSLIVSRKWFSVIPTVS